MDGQRHALLPPRPSAGCTRSRSSLLSSPNFLNCGDDAGICTATTDVAAHRLAYVVIARPPRLLHHCRRRHDLARGAVPALETIVLDECALHRMELVARRKSLDGRDALSLLHNGEGHARQDASALYVHGTRTALAVIAPLLGPGETSVFTECIEQRDARLDVDRDLAPVDV